MPRQKRRCLLQWHYGMIGPIYYVNPDGRSGWSGYHGADTFNANQICDSCATEWRANYPGYPLPDVSEVDA